MMFPSTTVKDGRLRTIEAEDDTMEPTFSKGDGLLIDTGVGGYTHEGLYALTNPYGCRQIYRAHGNFRGGVRVFHDNELYGPGYDLSRADFDRLLFGKVLAIAKVVDPTGVQRLMQGPAG